MNYKKLDNDQKELVRYWFEKYLEDDMMSTHNFIEKHLTPEPVIKVGFWYKDAKNKFLVFIEDMECIPDEDGNTIRAYGFSKNGTWMNPELRDYDYIKTLKEATPEEYEPRLIELAKSKGYKNGNYIDVYVPHLQSENVKEEFYYDFNLKAVIHGTKSKGNFIMKDGKWAEIINEKADIKEEISQLGERLEKLKGRL